jgi:hypothetical protein
VLARGNWDWATRGRGGSPINQADVYSGSKSVNNKRLVLLRLVGNQCMVGSGEINLCVCLMGEHYALSGCDLTSRMRSVVRKGKARILNFA